jgi:gas vesicle protein
MNDGQIQALIVRVAALTDALDERSAQAVQEVTRSSERLRQTAKGLDTQGQQLAQEVVSTVGAEAHSVIKEGLQHAVKQCSADLQQAGRQATETARHLYEQSVALQRAQRGILWKGSIGLLAGTVLAVGALGYLAWTSWRTLEQAEFSDQILQATRAGTLTNCDGVLCLKVGKNAQRYGKNTDTFCCQNSLGTSEQRPRGGRILNSGEPTRGELFRGALKGRRLRIAAA